MRALKLLGATLLALPLCAQASDIYRCEIDGVIEFSDQPCQTDSVPYQPAGSISVIEPAQDLSSIQQRNQDWLDQHRDRQTREDEIAAARRLAAAQTTPTPAPPQPARVISPWAWQPPTYRPPVRPPVRPPSEFEPPPQRYSALSGPFPGTRRRASNDSTTSDQR
ncbi:MAG: hypothetical protein AAGJ52_11050 [Pseudomonadota bacterium]